jgi:hypothetical protein
VNRVVGSGLQHQLHVQMRAGAATPAERRAALDKPATRKGLSKAHGNSSALLDCVVVALEDIPEGSFVCEWTGQYVLGDSRPGIPATVSLNRAAVDTSAAPGIACYPLPSPLPYSLPSPLLVAETLLLPAARRLGCDGRGGLVPVDMWESTFPLLDAVGWGNAQIPAAAPPGPVTSKKTTPLKDAASHSKRRRLSPGDEAVLEEASSSNSNTDCNYEEADANFREFMQNIIYVSNPVLSVCLLWSTRHELIFQLICMHCFMNLPIQQVDSRYYSNVSRFIILTDQKNKSNLSRRCVHVDDDGNKLHPRLALFANQMIPAGTELVLY